MSTSDSENRILRRADAMSLCGVRRSMFDVLRKQEGFPRPIMLSDRVPGWWRDELVQWLNSRRERTNG